jgi:hypothetical protein
MSDYEASPQDAELDTEINDRLAFAGIGETPPKPVRPEIEPPHVPKSEGSLDQLHRSVDALDKLGIGLFPPKRKTSSG